MKTMRDRKKEDNGLAAAAAASFHSVSIEMFP